MLAVRNAPRIRNDAKYLLGPAIYDQLVTFDAGKTARLLVDRRGVHVVIPVKLGSLDDSSVDNVVPTSSVAISVT